MIKIWHQSFTVLDDVPFYRDALQEHVDASASAGVRVDLHGMSEGSYPTAYPGDHIRYSYLANLHKEQFVSAALAAEAAGYAAMFIATMPDTGYEDIRSLVDIPVIGYGQSSFLLAATVGTRVGLIHFIPELGQQVRRNVHCYGLGDLLMSVSRVPVEFGDLAEAFESPSRLVDAFRRSAREAIQKGADVLIPGEGPLNLLLARNGISRIDGVPVIDSLAVGIAMTEARIQLYANSGLYPTRRGFFGAKPPGETIAAVREAYLKNGISGPSRTSEAGA